MPRLVNSSRQVAELKPMAARGPAAEDPAVVSKTGRRKGPSWQFETATFAQKRYRLDGNEKGQESRTTTIYLAPPKTLPYTNA